MAKESKLKPYELEPNVIDFDHYKALNGFSYELTFTQDENGEEFYELLTEEDQEKLLEAILTDICFATSFIEPTNDNR